MWDFFGTDHGRNGWHSYVILWLRIAFGAHALLSGINYFHPLVPPPPYAISPIGPFVAEMTRIGMYDVIKVVEVVVGICLLLNLYVPLMLVLEMPTTVSIFYLSVVVDGGHRQMFTGPRELFYNAILMAAYASYFVPLLTARAQYSPIWGRKPLAAAPPRAGSSRS